MKLSMRAVGDSLFVFSIGGPKQNARSLLTSVPDTVFMLFHVVVLVLLSMVAFSTTFLSVQTIQQQIRIFEISVY